MQTWTVRARNLAEHAGNPIHTEAGATAAGFPGALVAGVTTYAYLTHPIVAEWGLDWVAGGGGELRLSSPVFEHDEVVCTPVVDDGAIVVQAFSGDAEPRATLRAVADGGPHRAPRDGQPLTSRRVELEGRWDVDYGERAGDDLDVYRREGVVHPAVWVGLANHVVAANLVHGPWIHLRSVIRHHALAPAGSLADVHAVVVDRFRRRSGERAIIDVVIEVDGRPVASLEHEAIVVLP